MLCVNICLTQLFLIFVLSGHIFPLIFSVNRSFKLQLRCVAFKPLLLAVRYLFICLNSIIIFSVIFLKENLYPSNIAIP